MSTKIMIPSASGGKSKLFIENMNPNVRTITFDITEFKKLIWTIQCHSQSGNTSSVTVKIRNKQGSERNVYSNSAVTSSTRSDVIDVENDTHIIYSRTHNWNNNTSFEVFATTDDELLFQ